MDFARERMRKIDGPDVRRLRAARSGAVAAAVPGLQHRRERADRGHPRQPSRPLRAGRAGRARGHGRLAELTVEGPRGTAGRRHPIVSDRLIDANFDLRRSICQLPAEQVEMVDVARAAAPRPIRRLRRRHHRHLSRRGDLRPARARPGAIGCRVIKPIMCA